MKPAADVKVLHDVVFEEFAWAETNDPKHRVDNTTSGWCEDFRDCTNVVYYTRPAAVGASDYSFTSNGVIGRIQVNCDQVLENEWVAYQINNTNLSTTDFPIIEGRVKVSNTNATIRVRVIFTTAGETQVYSGSPTTWTTFRLNMYDLVGNDTAESILIYVDDTNDTFAGGWISGYVDWLRVFELKGWSLAGSYTDGEYWNEDGVLRLEGNTTGSNWIGVVKTSESVSPTEYPYIVYRARAINGGIYRIVLGGAYVEHTNTEFEVFVKHVNDFTGTVSDPITQIGVRGGDNGQTDGGAEIDWVVFCREPHCISDNGHLLSVTTTYSEGIIPSYHLRVANPPLLQESIFYDNIEWSQTEKDNYNETTYQYAGWQCRCGDAGHWDLASGTGSDTSVGDVMQFTVTTGPTEWEHSPNVFLDTSHFRRCKIRLSVSNASAALSLRFHTTDGTWYESTTWNDTTVNTKHVDLYALCLGKTIDQIRVKISGNSYTGYVRFIKIFAEANMGYYSGRLKSSDVVSIELSPNSTDYYSCFVGYIGDTAGIEASQRMDIDGRSRAMKYHKILENEVHIETTVPFVYTDLISELGGRIRPDHVTDTPAYLWFYEITMTPYWDALNALAESVSFTMDIDYSEGLTFDFKRPKLIVDYFEADDPARPVMWREISDVAVNSGAVEEDWSIDSSGRAVSSASSYLFHEKWIDEPFELEVSWERDASDVGEDGVYFYYQDNENHYYIELDYDSNTLYVQKVVDGSPSSVGGASVTLSANTEYIVKLRVESGGNMYLFLDGELIASMTDTTFSEGRVGFETDQVAQIAYFRMRAIDSDYTLTDRKDITTSSFRKGFDDIVNYLWVWGKPSAKSQRVFAELSDQDSIDEYGVYEKLMIDHNTTNAGALKSQASTMLEESKDPSTDVGLTIRGNPNVTIGQIVLVDSAYLGERRKYYIQHYRHLFAGDGFFTELMLVKL